MFLVGKGSYGSFIVRFGLGDVHQLRQLFGGELLLEAVVDRQVVFRLAVVQIARIEGDRNQGEVAGVQPVGDRFAALCKRLGVRVLPHQPDVDVYVVVGAQVLVGLREVPAAAVQRDVDREGGNLLRPLELLIALVADLLGDGCLRLIAALAVFIDCLLYTSPSPRD